MSQNENYEQLSISADDLASRLASASPLQASKVLIETELYDQKKSLDIIDQVAQEFSKEGSGKALATPLLLGLFDGVLDGKQIKKFGLREKGITSSRLLNEVNQFSYESAASSDRSTDLLNERHQLQKIDVSGVNIAKRREYKHKDRNGRTVRGKVEDKSALKRYKQDQLNGNSHTLSAIEVNDKGQKRRLNERRVDPNNSHRNIDVDHTVPLKSLYGEYFSSKALTHADLKKAANIDENYALLSAKSNRVKSDKSWSEIKAISEQGKSLQKKLDQGGVLTEEENKILKKSKTYDKTFNDQTIENGVQVEKAARAKIELNLNKSVAENITKDLSAIGTDIKKVITGDADLKQLAKHANGLVGKAASNAASQAGTIAMSKGIGDLIILVLKPISYEIKDMFENGLIGDTGCTSKLGAIGYRFKRAFKYVMANIKTIGMDAFVDAFKNFAKLLFNAIVDMFVGLFQKILKVIVEGFNAIVDAFKIMLDKGRTPAEKGDAVLKIVATTVVTLLGFAFNTQIGEVLEKIPVIGSTLSEFSTLLISLLGSTVVVWLIDQADFFSLKHEKRRQRVREVFDLRIDQIKENTNLFETVSLEKLAADKLRFREINQRMTADIKENNDVRGSVENVADFMKIKLSTRTTDEFLELLSSKQSLVI